MPVASRRMRLKKKKKKKQKKTRQDDVRRGGNRSKQSQCTAVAEDDKLNECVRGRVYTMLNGG